MDCKQLNVCQETQGRFIDNTKFSYCYGRGFYLLKGVVSGKIDCGFSRMNKNPYIGSFVFNKIDSVGSKVYSCKKKILLFYGK